jgi:hypothetical protein
VALQAHFGFADFATFKHLTVRAPQGVRTSRSAAIRQLDDDGQGARRAGLKAKEPWPAPSEGCKPSKIPKPWQDRRTLISRARRSMRTSRRTASRRLAHGFCMWGRHAFREHMKENDHVQ